MHIDAIVKLGREAANRGETDKAMDLLMRAQVFKDIHKDVCQMLWTRAMTKLSIEEIRFSDTLPNDDFFSEMKMVSGEIADAVEERAWNEGERAQAGELDPKESSRTSTAIHEMIREEHVDRIVANIRSRYAVAQNLN